MNLAVGFDFDHTLGLDHGLEREAMFRLAADAGLALARDDRDASARAEIALARFRDGSATLAEALAGWLRRAEKAWTLREPPDARFRALALALVDERVTPVDGARAALDALAAHGVPHAILTNGWSPLQERKIARALGRFDGPILVSMQIGVQKPDPRAFARLREALGAPGASSVVYVGDNPRADVGGALAAGMRAVWLDEGVAYPPDLPPPTARIARLDDLWTTLRGLGTATSKT